MPRPADVLRVWDTREATPPGFAAAWQRRLACAPHHNFSMTLACLEWDAQHGRHARLALLDEGGAGAAIVLREESGEWHCGWPWRWQAVIEDPSREGPVGMSDAEAAWLFRHASALARPRRLRFFAPCPPPAGVPAVPAGRTLMQSLTHDDRAFLSAMDYSKRRGTRRARERGCEVVEATSHELWRGFAEAQVDTKRRHGECPEPVAEAPAYGEQWREWELPWMWLLVAVREGRVVSGFGLGLAEGGVLEGRTSATTEEGRKLGAFPLLIYEASVRARDRGYRWHNNGGDTFFKRDMVGTLAECVDIHCWLGGGPLWLAANPGEALGRCLARHARQLRQRLTRREAAKKD